MDRSHECCTGENRPKNGEVRCANAMLIMPVTVDTRLLIAGVCLRASGLRRRQLDSATLWQLSVSLPMSASPVSHPFHSPGSANGSIVAPMLLPAGQNLLMILWS